MNEQDVRKIVGSIIWWTEGTKSRKDKRWRNTWSYTIDVTNTNEEIIKLFLDFLRYDIGIDENRLKAQIQIHEGDSKEDLEKYWSNVTQIPIQRFTKTIIRPQGNKLGKTKGTCKVRYCDKSVYRKIEEVLNEVKNRAVVYR